MLTELLPAKCHSEVSGSGFRTCTAAQYTRHVTAPRPCYHYPVHSCPFHDSQLQCSTTSHRKISRDKHWVPAGDKPLTKGSAYRCEHEQANSTLPDAHNQHSFAICQKYYGILLAGSVEQLLNSLLESTVIMALHNCHQARPKRSSLQQV